MKNTVYVGIDIGKRNHEATILNESGKEIGNIKFPNSKKGTQKLLSQISQISQIPDSCEPSLGLEATGHYWLPLYCYLVDQGYRVIVLNPIQSDSLRNLYIRRTKTDKKDSFIIADILRIGRTPESQLANETTLELQTLCRTRVEFLDSVTSLKQRLICILDKIFPEYESIFSSVFIESSKALLKNGPTPEDILEWDISELSSFLKTESRGRFGETKAKELKEAAKESFGITIALEAFRFQMKLLLEQIEFIESQIHQIDLKVKGLMEKMDSSAYITSIKCIGAVLGASILGEIGDISRFSNPKKLVAYVGMDSTVHQSGQFMGTRSKVSKRGSPYLRRAIWSAAALGIRHNPVLSEYYKKKIGEGKHPQVAIGACARKLIHLIYYVLKERKLFDPKYQWSGNIQVEA